MEGEMLFHRPQKLVAHDEAITLSPFFSQANKVTRNLSEKSASKSATEVATAMLEWRLHGLNKELKNTSRQAQFLKRRHANIYR